MHHIGKWLIICLFFILPILSYAQPYYFKHYQINQGLSNNTVICSMQDSYGFIWFGTKDGLDRFDGNNFKHFDIPNQVSNTIANNIISLVEDHERNIWIGTDQGIYIYTPIKETFRLLHPDFANADVPVIKVDRENNIWFIANGLLYKHEHNNKTLRITNNTQFVTAILSSKKGKIFYGTLEGKICDVSPDGRISDILDLTKEYGKKDWFSIQKIVENEQGNLLFGTSKAGFGEFNLVSKQLKWILGVERLNHFLYVRDIHLAKQNEYWLATESGLYIYNYSTEEFINIKKSENNPWGISDNAIYNILEDRDGGIWLGTYFGGINYYHKNNSIIEKFMSKTQGGSLEGTVVRIIDKDNQGNIWLGTENGGLSKINHQTGEIENYTVDNSNLTNNNIHGLLPLDNQILLGTFVYGMDIFDYSKKKVVYHTDPNVRENEALKSNFLYYIYKNKKNEILIASTRGHYKLDAKTKRFTQILKVPLEMSYTTIMEDHAGNIWLGTWRDGLFVYHPEKDGFLQYNHESNNKNSLPNNKINCILQDSKKQIWIATEGGLAKIEPQNERKNRIKHIDIELPSKIVLAILEDKQQNLWISTSKGLVRYNPAQNTQRIFNIESGLPSIQFNYNSAFDDGNGMFYFGTINGMIRFDPAKLNQIQYNSKIPIYITNLVVNNKEIQQNSNQEILSQSLLFTDQIVLKYDEASFSLDFTALQFESPHSIKYSYKLEGMSSEWVTTTGSNRAHFTKLLPGNYEFIVKAEDPNGNPISTSRSLKIKILPPIWASIPAFILYFLIIAGLVSFIAYHFNEKIKQRNKQHLLRIQHLREQELYKSKINFYTDVVHEIRTPLTLIKAPLEKLISKVPANPTTDKLLQNIQSNTERLIALSTQLLDFRKVETKGYRFNLEIRNISDLTKDIIKTYKVTLESQNKKLNINIDKGVIANIDVDSYEKICNNLLNNALKYSEKIIEVTLQKHQMQDNLLLIIRNDGKLIPQEYRQQIFEPFNRLNHSKSISGSGLGLALCRALVNRLHGSLEYTITEQNFNTFTLSLPLNQNNNYER